MPECYICRRISDHHMTHESCLRNTDGFSGFKQVFVWKRYDGQARAIMKTYKYQSTEALGHTIAKLILPKIKVIFADLAPSNTIIVPVPIHSWRHNQRGFNQSLIISEYLAKGLDWLSIPDLLGRKTGSKHQAGLSRRERLDNIRNSFHINKAVALGISTIGTVRHIVLVDDVITTGSTISHAGKLIEKEFPSVSIYGITLFRGAVRAWPRVRSRQIRTRPFASTQDQEPMRTTKRNRTR